MTLPWSPELEAVEAKKRTEVEEAILATKGNVSQAARKLGVERSWLNALLNRFGLVEAARALRIETKGSSRGRPIGR